MLGEIWKIGDWSVFPAENTLRRDGSEVKVPPRLMDALIFFASKNTLIDWKAVDL